MNSIGEKIRYFRKLRGLSQEELAHELDISLTAYSKIERNITDINYSRLNQLCKILKITLIELLYADKNFESSKEEIQKLKTLLADKNNEIIQLQKQIISLLNKK
ncbi:MAG: helix-turn-helix domain-containing protein [Bacteroidia bacterium]|nr:helix-turn-helix domain-containing protein [Bacteroidia bacterium]